MKLNLKLRFKLFSDHLVLHNLFSFEFSLQVYEIWFGRVIGSLVVVTKQVFKLHVTVKVSNYW